MPTTALTSMYRDEEILQLVSRAPDTFVSSKNKGLLCVGVCRRLGTDRKTRREEYHWTVPSFLPNFKLSAACKLKQHAILCTHG